MKRLIRCSDTDARGVVKKGGDFQRRRCVLPAVRQAARFAFRAAQMIAGLSEWEYGARRLKVCRGALEKALHPGFRHGGGRFFQGVRSLPATIAGRLLNDLGLANNSKPDRPAANKAISTTASLERTLDFSTAEGERIYAIGDIHGCAYQLKALVDAICEDTLRRPLARVRLIVLGDFIDRGPHSAEVVRSLFNCRELGDRFVVLKGNHEHIMSKSLNGDQEALAMWLGVGGAGTLKSFGVDPWLIQEGASDRLLAAAQNAVGHEMRSWISSLPLIERSGGYVFVHAGIRPLVSLERQAAEDLLWIREPFLNDDKPREFCVVHGHTIYPEGPEWRPFRVGVDTGAFKTGRLTALGLESRSAWAVTS